MSRRSDRDPGRGGPAPLILLLAALLLGTSAAASQTSPIFLGSGYEPLTAEQEQEIRETLHGFRQDPRGPYLRIRWFCNDGTVLPPGPGACAEHGGGHQHAEPKPRARELAELGFHVGTVFQALDFADFRDLEHAGYRLRELPVTDYLERVDDGWVMQRARYYRGAAQAEDEERVGRRFLEELLSERDWRVAHPYLASALTAVVPHGQPGTSTGRVRGLAQSVADLDPGFQPLRVKIHSRPGPGDLAAVEEYLQGLPADAPDELRRQLQELQTALAVLYADTDVPGRLRAFGDRLEVVGLGDRLRRLAEELPRADHRRRVEDLGGLLRDARGLLRADDGLPANEPGAVALALLDLIDYGSDLLIRSANTWVRQHGALFAMSREGPSVAAEPAAVDAAERPTRAELLAFVTDLLDAGYGAGLLYRREYDALHGAATQTLQDSGTLTGEDGAGPYPAGPGAVDPTSEHRLTAATYHDRVRYLSHAIDWAQASVEQTFGMVLERYEDVEPLTRGFVDDTLRGSALLAYAEVIDVLGRDAGIALGQLHSVFDRDVYSGVMGLNPGLAIGPLRILEEVDDATDVDPEGIYVLPETPADLGRVAGILTLEEGSRLSHVQLLARSLGLPNAVVAPGLLETLQPMDGQQVFYAVSPLGTVVVKRVEGMTARELRSLEDRAREPEGEIRIDPGRLDLTARRILPLEDVDLEDSGRIVGPKAANLGRLVRLFPDRMAPGLVIPFGVFRQHIDRDLRGTGQSLYEDLVTIYARAEAARQEGSDEATVRRWVVGQLEEVRAIIVDMELLPQFVTALERSLEETFGPTGTYGVFVRSDTNVEDLPQFTGAGLNLTVMNQIGTERILEAVKRVWGSPYSERSYTWRQRLLTSPEHVYPSVVLLRSVPVDASGVVATTDLTGTEPDAWTVTLSRGVGGVVEGEPAETMLVPATGGPPVLLSSARAVWQNVLRMRGSGGIARVPVGGDSLLLTPARLEDLRSVVNDVIDRYPPVVGDDGEPLPWDIEFGFVDDRVTLFQIRPLVDNRRADLLRATAALDEAALEAGGAPVVLEEPPRLGRAASGDR